MTSQHSNKINVLASDLVFDFITGDLVGPTATIRLTPIEGNLLQYLADRRGTIISREELLMNVWQIPEGSGTSEVVRTHLKNLRRKLREASPSADILVTTRSRGLTLKVGT